MVQLLSASILMSCKDVCICCIENGECQLLLAVCIVFVNALEKL